MGMDRIAWFEVATHDAEGTQEFFGELFGWTFAPDPVAAAAGMDYRLVTYRGGEEPVGGIFGGGVMPDHAVFSVVVTDVADTCERAEKLGGVVVQAVTQPQAGPAFAYLKDRSGNLFGIFSRPEQPE